MEQDESSWSRPSRAARMTWAAAGVAAPQGNRSGHGRQGLAARPLDGARGGSPAILGDPGSAAARRRADVLPRHSDVIKTDRGEMLSATAWGSTRARSSAGSVIGSSRVVVGDFLDGARLAFDFAASATAGDHPGMILEQFDLEEPLRHRLPNGDPRPENALFLPDDRVAFLDFGFFRNLDDRTGVSA